MRDKPGGRREPGTSQATGSQLTASQRQATDGSAVPGSGRAAEPDTRERIVRAGARLFLTRSYTSVGIADVCAAAGVHKGSFYHFFPAKADLGRAVIDLHAGYFERQLDVESGRAPDPARELLAVAVAVASVQAGFERRFGRIVGCPFGNLAAELATIETELGEHLAGVFGRWQERLAAACRRAAAAGVLRPGTSPDQLAQAILAQTQGLILLAKVRSSPADEIGAGLRAMISAYLTDGDPARTDLARTDQASGHKTSSHKTKSEAVRS
jgi:TetR/AcrR family transcriptional regulator, transcriptional repressor for nem operon